MDKRFELVGTTAMEDFGASLVNAGCTQGIIYLTGRLGAGKTTLTRGILHALGHSGAVKSPTFTLIEPYLLPNGSNVYHFDLYRVNDPEELALIGAEEYFAATALCIIEWPERGEGWLPVADCCIDIEYADDRRHVTVKGKSAHGEQIIHAL